MRFTSFFSLLLLDTMYIVSSTCLDHISPNTMAVFSGAPYTFVTNYENGSACAGYCDRLPECTAWLYSVRGGECQLYKATALSTFTSQHFMYGICDGHRPPAASSSVAVVSASPTASAAVSNTISRHRSISIVIVIIMGITFKKGSKQSD
ncbi:hypothetical protein ASPCADRAFT_134931, partial [Aspergillus carbonarius ITEM 5010]